MSNNVPTDNNKTNRAWYLLLLAPLSCCGLPLVAALVSFAAWWGAAFIGLAAIAIIVVVLIIFWTNRKKCESGMGRSCSEDKGDRERREVGREKH